MTIPSWARDWRVVAGGVGLLGGLAWLLAWRPSSSSGVAPPPDFSGRWVELPSGDSVRLVRGVRYRGCVRLFALSPARAVLTVERLRVALEEKGFSAVRVASGDTPPNWEDGIDCFRYVDATWSKADQDLDRPSAVALSWRWEPSNK